MKNIIYILVLFASVTIGCKKDNAAEGQLGAEKREVTFSVSNLVKAVEQFDKSHASVKAAGDTLRNHAKYLYFVLYNFNSIYRPVVLEQTADSASFGTFKLKLVSGQYDVSFFASNQKLYVDDGDKYYRLNFQRRELDYWEDLFYKRYTLKVQDQDLNVDIRLERMVAALEVNIEDEIPSNASKITIEVTADASGGNVVEHYYDDVTSLKEFQLKSSQLGQKDQKFLVHIFDRSHNRNWRVVTIRAHDSGNRVIAEKVVPLGSAVIEGGKNLVATGKKTIITGSLFTPTTKSTALSASVNPTWSVSETVTF